MATTDPTAHSAQPHGPDDPAHDPAGDPAVERTVAALTGRVEQLDKASRVLDSLGYPGQAYVVARERDRIGAQLADLGGPPTLADALTLLAAVSDALEISPGGLSAATRGARAVDRARWVRSAIAGALHGDGDLRAAAAFLRDEIERPARAYVEPAEAPEVAADAGT
jgi:hypothetical protein